MRLTVKNLGPIAEADVEFGQLTVLIGPQAVGKSLFLQTYSLVRDQVQIKRELTKFGGFWQNDQEFAELIYGEGATAIWTKETSVVYQKKPFSIQDSSHPYSSSVTGRWRVFYIPAQRVLALQRGWPRPFDGYDAGDPYLLRHFSEQLRRQMELPGYGAGLQAVFSSPDGTSATVAREVTNTVYQAGSLAVDTHRKGKQFVQTVDGQKLPFMSWSAGQREFLPLLLGISRTLPNPGSTKGQFDVVVIEEPEMGLHPRAIQTFMLLVFQLLLTHQRVVLSTHSPIILEMAWALRYLQKGGAKAADVAKLFDIEASANLAPLFERALKTETKVYYFDRSADDGRVRARDISTLDAESEDLGISEWGGLSTFATRAGDIVSQVMARAL